MIFDTTVKPHHKTGIKETTTVERNWIKLLRKYKTGNISIIEENILRLYAEIYGIFLED